MKNPYVKAAVQTLAFILYVVLVAVGFSLLKDTVGTDAANTIFYGALAGFGIAVIFMLNLARARFNAKD